MGDVTSLLCRDYGAWGRGVRNTKIIPLARKDLVSVSLSNRL